MHKFHARIPNLITRFRFKILNFFLLFTTNVFSNPICKIEVLRENGSRSRYRIILRVGSTSVEVFNKFDQLHSEPIRISPSSLLYLMVQNNACNGTSICMDLQPTLWCHTNHLCKSVCLMLINGISCNRSASWK